MDLLHSLLNVLESLVGLFAALGRTATPWLPLFAWIAFWTFAVDWVKLTPILARGGIIGVLLIALMTVLVWAAIAPPPDGVHHLFGLAVSNVTGKLVYVVALIFIASMCSSVQLSGTVAPLLNFNPPALVAAEEADAHDGHGHDDHGHGDHGHGDHGDHLAVHAH
jgi:hypothetical protein